MSEWIPLADSTQMAKIDHLSETKYQINPESLMESAGSVTAKKILSSNNFNTQQVIILCGPGNNGGDGLAAGRYLLSSGIKVKIFCPQSSRSPLVQKEKLKNQNLYSIEDVELIKKTGEQSTLIIDALFGIGLSKNIEGIYFKIIKWINQSGKQIISLDVPSGLNCNTGQVQGITVKAHHTFSFGLSKVGFYLSKGSSHTGQISVLPIGFPKNLILEQANSYFLIDEPWVSSKLPHRKADDHKAKQGHLLVLAGHEGFWGAGILSSLSAYRMGAGYVTWAGRGGYPPLDSVPEVLTKKTSDTNLFTNKKAVVIGPGLGAHTETKDLLLELKKTKIPVLVDADAFTICVQENLFPLPSNWVVTPHSGELARLFELKGEDIDQDRILFAQKAFQKIGALVLLKGLHPVLVNQEKCFIIPTGNSALAKAGTGDVLSGFIGALMARSLSPFTAAAVGAFIHGKLADEWVRSGKDSDTLMAQDLKDLLPSLLKKLR